MSQTTVVASDLFVIAVPAAYAVDESGVVVGYTPISGGEAASQAMRVRARIEEMDAPRAHVASPVVVAPAPRKWAWRSIVGRQYDPEREFVLDEA